MATAATTAQSPAIQPSSGITSRLLLPAYTLWLRELVRFYRQPARVVGVIAAPLLFWVVLGSGFARTFQSGAATGGHYLAYYFPGSVALIVLFTAIFSMMSLIQDRNEGFLLSVLAAPVSRGAIVLGKVLGGATLAAVQGALFLVFTPLVGIHLTVASLLMAIFVILLISFSLTALGFLTAWPMDSTQAFHAIVNIILIPLWMLSGSMFPASGASGWLRFFMRINPLTYQVDALRNALFPAQKTDFSSTVNLSVSILFCLLMFVASSLIVNRRSNKPAA